MNKTIPNLFGLCCFDSGGAGVLKVMMPYFAEKFGNPGSLHSFGQEAIGAMDKARGAVAKAVGADFRNIIFRLGSGGE